MTNRLVLTLVLALALSAPLTGCAKKGKLETPPDSTSDRVYPPAAS